MVNVKAIWAEYRDGPYFQSEIDLVCSEERMLEYLFEVMWLLL